MSDEKRIVEIGGVKMEVDLRYASTIDALKVGERVKVLVKSYNDQFTSHFGTIIGFDDFKNLPTIIVAYLDVSYSEASVKFLYINAKSAGEEMVLANDDDAPFSRQQAEELIDKAITAKENELAGLKYRKAQFEKWCGRYFAETK